MIAAIGSLRKPWVIKEILPEGLALVSGSSESGIRWLIYQLATAVAYGHPFLRQTGDSTEREEPTDFPAVPGKVLLLLPEEIFLNPHHSILQPDHQVGMLTGDPVATLRYADDGNERQRIAQQLKMHPDIRVIIMGPLAQPSSNGLLAADGYVPGYRTLEELRAIANKHHVAILLFYGKPHLLVKDGKASTRRLVSRAGVFDSVIQLKHAKTTQSAQLLIARRGNLPMILDLSLNEHAGWVCHQQREHAQKTWELQLSNRFRIIYEIMCQSPADAWSAEEIAHRAGISLHKIRSSLSLMTRDGYVARVSVGYYRLPGTDESEKITSGSDG